METNTQTKLLRWTPQPGDVVATHCGDPKAMIEDALVLSDVDYFDYICVIYSTKWSYPKWIPLRWILFLVGSEMPNQIGYYWIKIPGRAWNIYHVVGIDSRGFQLESYRFHRELISQSDILGCQWVEPPNL